MSVTVQQNSLSANVGFSWIGTNISGFGSPSVGGSDNFQLILDLTIWNEVYAATLIINAAQTTTLDLTSVPDAICGADFSFGHLKYLWLQPVGSDITLAGGASNPANWYWSSSATLTIRNGGIEIHSDAASTTGFAVTSGAKTLAITNLTAAGTAWNSGTAYVVGNIVSYSSANWIAIQNGTNQTPSGSSAYWSITNQCTCSIVIAGSSS